jgi:hypothetical protein
MDWMQGAQAEGLQKLELRAMVGKLKRKAAAGVEAEAAGGSSANAMAGSKKQRKKPQ